MSALIAAITIVVLVTGGWYYMNGADPLLGFAYGNGRLEATEIDIASKLQGRITEILVDEGDWVEAGQTVARMDAKTLQAQLKQAEARVRQARHAMLSASALVAQRESELNYAEREFDRTVNLLQKGYITREEYDADQTRRLTAEATLNAAEAQVTEAQSAIEAAIADVERVKVELDDSVLKSPCGCRVLYRLAEPGEVLPAGGKVLVVLDLSDVYMSIFLPALEANRVEIGAEARIVFDARPDIAVPATVSFVAVRSQFTPKEVETRDERAKLMFRVKVRIAAGLLERYRQLVKTGVPGVAYVRLDDEQPWPAELEPPPELL
jgi:HlyD family secretion protein